jgi:hypothetical protein
MRGSQTDAQITRRLKRIISVIKRESRALKLSGGTKAWFCYRLDITELVWGRNLMDGYQIEVYDRIRSNHLGTITVDNNLNKIYIDNE